MAERINAAMVQALAARVRRLEAAQGAGSVNTAPPTTITNHAALSNLTFSDSGHVGFMGVRRDVYANRGDPEDYQTQLFAENRQGTSQGDRLWVSMMDDGGDWQWAHVISLP